ncbi:hydroxymethylglutaryl-CoA lyase [Candidimonas nitroreducens]|uniref:Hydroxymethylglutaryl-CoA lyase n=1 Tax=Candidimonas nitroreducens TaxID=683354 RepID=A0A225MR53_9BURK|nr:hydroxymethylglutaryl-CoA lyase [Candidimonas nitroreducens]OWT63708.1 hydroxymethylglutaryl-CoA lyase [Candidimonas nitroreducens]
MQARDVLISEVGPRDGLQNIATIMPTPAKTQWIRALAASGLQEIEIGSFVHPKLLPQMADAEEVARQALQIPELDVLALVPNLKGAERALAVGVRKISIPVSASQSHNMANVRMSCEQSIAAIADICAYRDEQAKNGVRATVEVGIASAFGCSREGIVPEDWVMEMAERLARAGADSIGLSDSVGAANPVQVRRMFGRLRHLLGNRAGGAHLHNTRGQGLANAVAAIEAGVTTLDSSQAGLGGCPYAPGATGNIVTEDLVYLLESMGLDTGIDLGALMQARALLAQALSGENLYGHLADAGVNRGFRYANPGRTRQCPPPGAHQDSCQSLAETCGLASDKDRA